MELMVLRRRAVVTFILLLLFTAILWIHPAIISLPPVPRLSKPSSSMSVTHIVLFQFKSSASADDISNVSKEMLALKDNCIHPTSQKPYIISASGGTDNSIEGIQNGITHAFVVEFGSAEDRDYYVDKDPVHQTFKTLAGKALEKAQVVDFTDGVFKQS